MTAIGVRIRIKRKREQEKIESLEDKQPEENSTSNA